MGEEPTILYCPCSDRARFPDSAKSPLREALASLDAELWIVSDLCGMAARKDPALTRLARLPRLAVVACRPRAVRWLFHRAEAPLAEDALLFDLACQSPGEIVQTLAAQGFQPGAARLREVPAPAEDPWPPWYPVIDYDRCSHCGQCASFCLFDVYRRAEGPRFEVTHPTQCKNLCPACARICPETAIIFPKCGESPLDGDAVPDGPARRERICAEAEKILGANPYEALLQRRARRLVRPEWLTGAAPDGQAAATPPPGAVP